MTTITLPLPEAARRFLDMMLGGQLRHRYMGDCPSPSNPESTDPNCSACHAITLLRAALEQPQADTAPVPDQWQPIETAPKDGTEVLLGALGRVTYGYWLMPSDKPRIKYEDGFAPEEVWEEFEPCWMSWDGGFSEDSPPTHWQPLPPAPGEPVPAPSDALALLREARDALSDCERDGCGLWASLIYKIDALLPRSEGEKG